MEQSNEHACRGMLRQVWNNANANEEHKRMYERVTGRVKTFEECAFVIDQALPYDIVRELHLMPDEMAAVLNCWHNKMVAAPRSGGFVAIDAFRGEIGTKRGFGAGITPFQRRRGGGAQEVWGGAR
jgi:hypothetical protein